MIRVIGIEYEIWHVWKVERDYGWKNYSMQMQQWILNQKLPLERGWNVNRWIRRCDLNSTQFNTYKLLPLSFTFTIVLISGSTIHLDILRSDYPVASAIFSFQLFLFCELMEIVHTAMTGRRISMYLLQSIAIKSSKIKSLYTPVASSKTCTTFW